MYSRPYCDTIKHIRQKISEVLSNELWPWVGIGKCLYFCICGLHSHSSPHGGGPPTPWSFATRSFLVRVDACERGTWMGSLQPCPGLQSPSSLQPGPVLSPIAEIAEVDPPSSFWREQAVAHVTCKPSRSQSKIITMSSDAAWKRRRKRRVGKTLFRLQPLWRVVPPWAGWAEGHPPHGWHHGWHAHGASSLCFGSPVAFSPVWKTATGQASELGGLSAEPL